MQYKVTIEAVQGVQKVGYNAGEPVLSTIYEQMLDNLEIETVVKFLNGIEAKMPDHYTPVPMPDGVDIENEATSGQ